MRVEEEVAGADGVGGGAAFVAGEMHDRVAVFSFVLRPVGETVCRIVGIARLDEVGPIGGHGVGNFEIVFAPGYVFVGELESLKDVFDFAGVTRAGFGDGNVAHHAAGLGFGNLFEMILVDRGFSGLDVEVHPFPGGIGDEVVAGKSFGGDESFVVV